MMMAMMYKLSFNVVAADSTYSQKARPIVKIFFQFNSITFMPVVSHTCT